MRYSKAFTRDFEFYLRHRHEYNFSGSEFDYPNKMEMVISSTDGVTSKKALFDAENGYITPTKHPVTLKVLLKAKASINLQIKMWAQGRADFTLPKIEFKDFDILPWMRKAVEHQKFKYYKDN